MKKRIKNIAVFFVAAAFLLTANGIFFIKHSCSKEKTSEIVFLHAEKKDCCKGENSCVVQKEENSTDSCCSKKIKKTEDIAKTKAYKEKCCTYKNVFVKIVNSFFNSAFEKLHNNSVFVCNILISPDHNFYVYNEIEANSKPPPLNRPPIYQQTKTFRL